MKSVFLLGDSIRMAYDEYVREYLQGIADVFYPDENGRFTQYTLRALQDWVPLVSDPKEISVVHWNNGLWDLARFYDDPEPLNSPEIYAYTLRRIIRRIRLLFPRAQIVFALTTPLSPVHAHAPNVFRTDDDIRTYNRIARKVMEETGIPVNDLYTFIKGMGGDVYSDWLHPNEQGARLLAEEVVHMIGPFIRETGSA